MGEPRSTTLRPIGMLRIVLAVPALLLVAACGSVSGSGSADTPGSSESPGPRPVESITCTVPPHADYSALASVDLTGDGKPEQPFVIGDRAKSCPDHLYVEVDGKGVALDLHGTALDPRGAAILVPGRAGQLLLATEQHPRGGYQSHLYGYADGKLAELTVDGRPLLPFVATDTPKSTTPMTASCTRDGITVTSGRFHEPVGVAFAWDLYETTYSIRGNVVTAGNAHEVARNVLPEQLLGAHPALARHQLFANCVAANPGGVVTQ